MEKRPIFEAFSVLPSRDLQADVQFFTAELGFHLLALLPAGNPLQAELEGYGLKIRLNGRERAREGGCIVIRTHSALENDSLVSPGGTRVIIEVEELTAPQSIEKHSAEICTLRTTPWQRGKAGTQMRELIPSRLGGGIIATHIRIPNGGLVNDRVHYHTADFQLVFCVQGWITIVYEDQGEPLTLMAGDCVTQPPHIRHRVLETSNGLELLEIGLPAEHVTAIDNEMSLPTLRVDSHRLYNGQRFCHFRHTACQWQRHRLPGFVAADTGVSRASGNIAGARIVKSNQADVSFKARHTADVLFSYVLTGSVRVNKQLMVAGDAYTLPQEELHAFSDLSHDVSILEFSVPGEFSTDI